MGGMNYKPEREREREREREIQDCKEDTQWSTPIASLLQAASLQGLAQKQNWMNLAGDE